MAKRPSPEAWLLDYAGWINIDLIWSVALIGAGLLTVLFTG